MTSDGSSADPPVVVGDRISALVEKLVAEESVQKSSAEQRAVSVAGISGTLLTAGSLVVSISGSPADEALGGAGRLPFVAAMLLFAVSTCFAALVNMPASTLVPAIEGDGGLQDIADSDHYWRPSSLIERRVTQARIVQLASLRKINARHMTLLFVAVVLQGCALMSLALGVSIVMLNGQ